MTSGSEFLLRIRNLGVEFRTRNGIVHALENVSWSLKASETIGIVGESGSGKSVTAYAILGLLDRAARITSGTVYYNNEDLLTMQERALRKIRGRSIGIIFQNPRSALNPIRTVGRQLEDVLVDHVGLRSAEARRRSIELLSAVRIADPERRMNAYPFELSGGMCQRVMIALSLACSPALMIADEPTTGLDVTTQATIMDLIKELAVGRNMATVLITHDLGLAAEYCDRIVVMHAGHVIETAETKDLFVNPAHPYTQRLISSTPKKRGRLSELITIPGRLPDLRRSDLPPCRYSERCEYVTPQCSTSPLPTVEVSSGHWVTCWRARRGPTS